MFEHLFWGYFAEHLSICSQWQGVAVGSCVNFQSEFTGDTGSVVENFEGYECVITLPGIHCVDLQAVVGSTGFVAAIFFIALV